ncbi:MAG: outer membrane beta-barrel domain-containing protein [Oligoflexia bacterium]|nr:outer membrane beta-barrel domain-containing protein [Oligoflexia bacterium]
MATRIGLCLLGMVVVFLLGSNDSKAEEDGPLIPKIIAVTKRPYLLSQEISIYGGYLPLDSFVRYAAVGGSYTYYFSDFIGWEVINGYYLASLPTGLEQELGNRFGAASEDKFDTINYFGTSNVVFTPFYSKHLLFGDTIVYGELSLVAGMGLSKFDTGNVNCADIGAFFRFVTSAHTSIKFDIRDYIYFGGNSRNNLVVALGFAYNFGDPPAQTTGVESEEE